MSAIDELIEAWKKPYGYRLECAPKAMEEIRDRLISLEENRLDGTNKMAVLDWKAHNISERLKALERLQAPPVADHETPFVSNKPELLIEDDQQPATVKDSLTTDSPPVCPVCGEEMELGSLQGWFCKNGAERHHFSGPYGDPTGEKTRNMIAKVRQEGLVTSLLVRGDTFRERAKTAEARVKELEKRVESDSAEAMALVMSLESTVARMKPVFEAAMKWDNPYQSFMAVEVARMAFRQAQAGEVKP